jgi:putative sporulation protein YtaF
MSILFLSILIAIAANLDNLGVGIAYGVQKIKISHIVNLIIAVISFIATWLSAVTGEAISLYLSPKVANIIGAVLLCGVGLWVISQPIITAYKANQPIVDVKLLGTRIYLGPTEILRYPERVDLDNSRDVGYWEAVLLGIALSINALAGGFDAGTVGISSLLEATLVGIFSLFTLAVGSYFGKKYAAEQLGKYATVISGTLLILIGVHQLWH